MIGSSPSFEDIFVTIANGFGSRLAPTIEALVELRDCSDLALTVTRAV